MQEFTFQFYKNRQHLYTKVFNAETKEKAFEMANDFLEQTQYEERICVTIKSNTDNIKTKTPIVKSLNNWTKKELENLPIKNWNDIGEFDSLIILPTKQTHDSGFQCMDFIVVNDGTPFCKLSGGSDVIRITGIGSYGVWTAKKGIPTLIPPKRWSVVCLKKSKLIRLSCENKLEAGYLASSFNLYSVK